MSPSDLPVAAPTPHQEKEPMTDHTARIQALVATIRATMQPCPLCGTAAYAVWVVNGEQMFKVGCASCGLELKAAWYRDCSAPTKDIAALWNSRVAAPTPETPSQWQPIATCPKDGTPVILYYEGEVYKGAWRQSASGELAWRVNNLWLRPKHPTRWMPMPTNDPTPLAGAVSHPQPEGRKGE